MIGFETNENDEADLLKGVIAGVAGGLLASFLMEQFQALWSKVAVALQSRPANKSAKEESEPATVKTAQAISKKVFGREVSKENADAAGEAVHYGMGAASAAVYGVLAEVAPIVTAGDGLAFGTGVWLLADEVAVPATGLSKPPQQIPLTTHVYAFVSHLVYGWTTELVRRAVRKAL